MRIISYLACGLLSCQIVLAQSDLQKMNVKGKPTMIVTKEYLAKDEFGKPTKGALERHMVAKFNKAGNMTEEVMYKADGSISLKRVAECDASGKKLSQGMYYGSGSLAQKEVYQYDASGKLTLTTRYNEKGEATGKTEYKYDAKGYLTEELDYSLTSDKKEPAKEIRKNDEVGNPIERIFTNPFLADQKGVVSITYDEQGNITTLNSQTIKLSNNEVKYSGITTLTYQYDTNKNWTSQTFYEGEAKIVKRIIERTYTY